MRSPKRTAIRTARPADAAPVACYRFGATVILRYTTIGPAVLTPAEARTLAETLVREADLADTTPWTGTSAGSTRQLPVD